MLVDGLGVMLLTIIFALFGAHFHVVFSRCFLQSLSELLQFLFTASEQINVIGKLQVAMDRMAGRWHTAILICTGHRRFDLPPGMVLGGTLELWMGLFDRPPIGSY